MNLLRSLIFRMRDRWYQRKMARMFDFPPIRF